MGFSRLPCPPSGELPNPGIKPISLTSPALAPPRKSLIKWGGGTIDLTNEEMGTKTPAFFDILLIYSVNPEDAKEIRIISVDYEKQHVIRMFSPVQSLSRVQLFVTP